MNSNLAFLPISADECAKLGWDRPDFVYVNGDAYVDHPSFGCSIITRYLENAGFRVAVLAQPDWQSCDDFKRFGQPRLGFLVSAGNLDSMVSHYTVNKKRRSKDYYSPGGKMGKRPDRAVIVYCNRVREAYPDSPIIIGGLEASLRRLGHYDYWSDKMRRSILLDSRADLLSYGMGEHSILRIAQLLDKGVPISKIRDVRGTVWCGKRGDKILFDSVETFDYSEICTDKKKYAKSFSIAYTETDAVRGRAVCEYYGDRMIVQNPPSYPLTRDELDLVYSLPYVRDYHPTYEKDGGIPAITEVKFSITHNRGCFGGCNFCALAFHQGRSVSSRSIESCVNEAKILASMPDFKGYIHDVGGPTANFRTPSCKKQLTDGICANRKCLAPKPCPNLEVDHSEYIALLKEISKVEGVKKVFIRSGIRFDYLMLDKSDAFFKKLVSDHVSGQLKVAPEHCSASVLRLMGKPSFDVYNSFKDKYFSLCKKYGKEQYIIPYLISSHPGSTLKDAIELAEYMKANGGTTEQVQDFYPTPGTISTVMYYTAINPFTMKEVYCENDPHVKAMQRALLQYNKAENASLVREALIKGGREDLIGYEKNCLVRPESGAKAKQTDKVDFKRTNADRRNNFVDKRGDKSKYDSKRLNDRAYKSKSAQIVKSKSNKQAKKRKK